MQFMIHHFKLQKQIWILLFGMVLIASGVGILHIDIYKNVVSSELIPGALSQDLISFAVAVFALILTCVVKKHHIKIQIILFGLLGYLFYAYGIYVIERTYNMYYLIYMAIFALSFWAIIFGLADLKKEILKNVSLGKILRRISAAGALLQPIIFYPLWIGMLLPLMRTGSQIDSLYSIFILDLVFIMPAFAILAYYTLKNRGIGLLLLPGVYLFGFTLIFSLALGEMLKPFFSMNMKIDSLIQSLVLSLFFLVLGILHLKKLVVK